MAWQEPIKLLAKKDDPTDNQHWRNIARECLLILELLDSGMIALGKASSMDMEGHYYNAFFGLSVGIERLAKLILVTEHTVTSGKLPTNDVIESYRNNYGHDLIKLLDKIQKITTMLNLTHSRPHNEISRAIINCLNSFASAGKGRYANFNFLNDPQDENEFEPIKKWWNEVAEPILKEHYIGTAIEEKIKEEIANTPKKYKTAGHLLLCLNEKGILLKGERKILEWGKQTQIVQKYGCYYTLTIARWMAELFVVLSKNCTDKTLFRYSEHFEVFLMSDDELKAKIKCP